MRRKEGDGYRSARKQKERKTEEEVGGLCFRRSEREGTVKRCTTELHGGDYRPISTPHRSGITMKKKILSSR